MCAHLDYRKSNQKIWSKTEQKLNFNQGFPYDSYINGPSIEYIRTKPKLMTEKT